MTLQLQISLLKKNLFLTRCRRRFIRELKQRRRQRQERRLEKMDLNFNLEFRNLELFRKPSGLKTLPKLKM